MPWTWMLNSALALGWKPADLWAATLYELETAIWVSSRPPEAPAMSEDDQRAFWGAIKPKE